jgi:predicted metal-dependent phosphoesterase TrpH
VTGNVSKWLFCDFHVHTGFRDGMVLLHWVADLYGSHGFDAISISDHILDD